MSRLTFMTDCETAIQAISEEITYLKRLVASGKQLSADEVAWLSEVVDSAQSLRDALVSKSGPAPMPRWLQQTDTRNTSGQFGLTSFGKKQYRSAALKRS